MLGEAERYLQKSISDGSHEASSGSGGAVAMVVMLCLGVTGLVLCLMALYLADYYRRLYQSQRAQIFLQMRQQVESELAAKIAQAERVTNIQLKLKTVAWAKTTMVSDVATRTVGTMEPVDLEAGLTDSSDESVTENDLEAVGAADSNEAPERDSEAPLCKKRSDSGSVSDSSGTTSTCEFSDPHGSSESSKCGGDDEEEEEDCCYICLAAFEENERVAVANNPKCRHLFHQACMTSWLMKQDGCPVCRQIYLEAEEETQTETSEQ